MHDTVFVVAKNTQELIENIKQKVIAFESFHIDSWVVLQNVDGHEISLTDTKQTTENKLFFVNLGSYLAGKFGENHFMQFCVAKTRSEAIEVAKKMVKPKNMSTNMYVGGRQAAPLKHGVALG